MAIVNELEAPVQSSVGLAGSSQPKTFRVPTTPVDGNGEVVAFIGPGVEFKGEIRYQGSVQIDGVLEGEIHTTGTLLVGEQAVINATVSAGSVISKGKINGDVVANEKVQLLSSAVMDGSLKTPKLSMEIGVLFNGDISMNSGTGTVSEDKATKGKDSFSLQKPGSSQGFSTSKKSKGGEGADETISSPTGSGPHAVQSPTAGESHSTALSSSDKGAKDKSVSGA